MYISPSIILTSFFGVLAHILDCVIKLLFFFWNLWSWSAICFIPILVWYKPPFVSGFIRIQNWFISLIDCISLKIVWSIRFNGSRGSVKPRPIANWVSILTWLRWSIILRQEIINILFLIIQVNVEITPSFQIFFFLSLNDGLLHLVNWNWFKSQIHCLMSATCI